MTLDLSYAAVPLLIRRDMTHLAAGSGFVYHRSGQHYLVTAWHNLSGRHSETLKPLHTQGALPDNIVVQLPSILTSPALPSPMYSRCSVRFDIDDGVTTTYRVHAQGWPRVDIAVIPFDPEADLPWEGMLGDGSHFSMSRPVAFRQSDGMVSRVPYFDDSITSFPLPRQFANTPIYHTVGDSLFILGFPAGIMDSSATPIWKRATIATEPSIGWQRQNKFLVDAASRKGMSGAVAIYFDKQGQVPVPPGSSLKVSVPLHIIHGIYVGRIGDSEFEAQVGVVWKKAMIDEIIDNGVAAISTHEIELPVTAVRAAIASEFPKEGQPTAYIEEKPPLAYLTHYVLKTLNGRASPDLVRQEIKAYAATLEGREARL